MSGQSDNTGILEDIEMYVKYGVADTGRDAMGLVRKYENSPQVLKLFRIHYSTLPEAREDAVVKVSLLMHNQGVHLFVVGTEEYSYLYVASVENLLYLGEYGKDLPKELLSYFGYATQQEFLKDCPPAENLEEYPYEASGDGTKCTACGVVHGELHLLGCVVEICPWCEGQLSGCNCRFERLNSDEIEDEEQLETFIEMLDEKGRIPFSNKQSPAYPGTSKGIDETE